MYYLKNWRSNQSIFNVLFVKTFKNIQFDNKVTELVMRT